MSIYDRFSSVENLKLAYHFLKDEIKDSTLPLDPIWSPTIKCIDELGDEFFDALSSYISQGLYTPEASDFILAKKDNYDMRPISILTVVDRIVYQAVLNPDILGNAIDGKLHSFVYGNRLGKDTYLYPYKEKWIAYWDKQKEAYNNGYKWRVGLDLKTFFECINIDKLIEILEKKFIVEDSALLHLLRNQLITWSEYKDMNFGIPQGANPSHVLANAYLHPVDSYVNNELISDGFMYFRYADDIAIMAKNEKKIDNILEKIVFEMRKFHLRPNEKFRISRITDVEVIEELKIFGSSGLNITSSEKIATITKKLPKIFNKVKKRTNIDRTEQGNLNYYLKALDDMIEPRFLDELISILPYKQSSIHFICKYIGFHISSFFYQDEQILKDRYEEIWRIYSQTSDITWSKFWLLKLLSLPKISLSHSLFQKELDRILNDNNSKYLRPIALSYKLYNSNQDNGDITKQYIYDDIRRFIDTAKKDIEKAVYYYFVFVLAEAIGSNNLKALVSEALNSTSIEVQTVGLFLSKKFNYSPKGNLGRFVKIFIKLPIVNHQPQSTYQFTSKDNIERERIYIIKGVRLDGSLPDFLKMPVSSDKSNSKLDRLMFYSKDGLAEFRGRRYLFKSRCRALLTVLDNSKDTPFPIKDLIEKCNPMIANSHKHFNNERNIFDTIIYLKQKLQVEMCIRDSNLRKKLKRDTQLQLR